MREVKYERVRENEIKRERIENINKMEMTDE